MCLSHVHLRGAIPPCLPRYTYSVTGSPVWLDSHSCDVRHGNENPLSTLHIGFAEFRL